MSQEENSSNSEIAMITKTPENDRKVEPPVMRTPPVVSPEAWETARQQMLVKEKALTRARDALAAERRRMPWMPVDTAQRRGSGFFMKSASATRLCAVLVKGP